MPKIDVSVSFEEGEKHYSKSRADIFPVVAEFYRQKASINLNFLYKGKGDLELSVVIPKPDYSHIPEIIEVLQMIKEAKSPWERKNLNELLEEIVLPEVKKQEKAFPMRGYAHFNGTKSCVISLDNNIGKNRKDVGHEIAHSLGLDHPKDETPHRLRDYVFEGIPNMMSYEPPNKLGKYGFDILEIQAQKLWDNAMKRFGN